MKNKKHFTPTNIIVRMPNWIGDAVMATPVLGDLRRAFPQAKITVMCQKQMVSLFSHDQDVDETFTFVRPQCMRQRREIIDRLRAKHFDFGLLLTNSFSSAWWFWRAGIKCRMGFVKDGRRCLLTHQAHLPPTWQSFHQVDIYKSLLAGLGIKKSRTRPRLFCSREERTRARGIFSEYEALAASVIGINPAAAYGSAKCWPKERFIEVAKRLCEREGVRVCFFGDAKSAPLVQAICAELPSNVMNLAGKTTLKQLVCLIKQCRVFLTNDSGPMHIAAAVGTPIVALFGSTNDVVTGPYTSKAVVINKRVSCSPCYLRTCPIDFRCMMRIEVDEVYEKVLAWVERPGELLSAPFAHASK